MFYTSRMARKSKTRKSSSRKRSGGVIDVRSPSALKGFEKMLGDGPVTLVLVYADWCGACHKFRDEVWSPLTQMKNATMNRAAIREDMIGKSSLANVERKFYPTLLLVGNDKKPATFPGENGLPTNAMPRKDTLEEDRKTLTALVNTPVEAVGTVSPTLPTLSVKPAGEELPKSPFNKPPSATLLGNTNIATVSTNAATGPKPPDVGSDLVASQARATTASAAVTAEELKQAQKGGRLLRAIRNTTASLKAMLRLRKDHKRTRRNRRR